MYLFTYYSNISRVIYLICDNLKRKMITALPLRRILLATSLFLQQERSEIKAIIPTDDTEEKMVSLHLNIIRYQNNWKWGTQVAFSFFLIFHGHAINTNKLTCTNIFHPVALFLDLIDINMVVSSFPNITPALTWMHTQGRMIHWKDNPYKGD